MFFTAKKEELGAINLYKKSCIYHGLHISLSTRVLKILQDVIDDNLKGVVTEVTARDAFTLGRRGLIRPDSDGNFIPTELGLLVAALAEAAGLISLKGKRP